MSTYAKAHQARQDHQQKCKNALLRSFIEKCFQYTATDYYQGVQFDFAKKSSGEVYQYDRAPRTTDDSYCNGQFIESDIHEAVSRLQSAGYSASLKKTGGAAAIQVDLTKEYKPPPKVPAKKPEPSVKVPAKKPEPTVTVPEKRPETAKVPTKKPEKFTSEDTPEHIHATHSEILFGSTVLGALATYFVLKSDK